MLKDLDDCEMRSSGAEPSDDEDGDENGDTQIAFGGENYQRKKIQGFHKGSHSMH